MRSAVHRYPEAGVYAARVLVCDRFGAEHRMRFAVEFVRGEWSVRRTWEPW